MPAALEALIAIIAFMWFVLIGAIGIIFLPIVLLLRMFIGEPLSKRLHVPYKTVDLDHHIHVPLEKVPPEYYEAYAVYLKSPEWKALRKVVLKRDHHACVDCKEGRFPLQVHHIHYDGVESMMFTPEQCVSVCHVCHKTRHNKQRR